MIRLGIDVGGTNTDAVVMDGSTVLAAHKLPTTKDVGDGVVAALRTVLGSAGREASEVGAVMIGTTHFTNAVVERRRLLKTATVRVAAPATRAVKPLTGWPADLRATIADESYIVKGGYNFDGRPIAALDEEEIKGVGAELRARGVRTVAITGVFSPINSDMETRVAELLTGGDGNGDGEGMYVSLGSDLGRIGLLQRENAAVLNACLREVADHVMTSFQRALEETGIDAPLFISQNDGTLMTAQWTARYPVLTFASGPTNSIRGAGFLSGEQEAIVVDIGGTTTDVGALRHGFPREASSEADIAGVRTNFRMPDVESVGLGGGSIVRQSDDGEVTIGPDSVGYELPTRALVFGGDTLTTTDVAVAAGYAEIGDRALVAHLDRALVERAVELIHEIVAEAVDRMRTSADPIPVVLVGGGAILVDRPLAGVETVSRPEHAGVANAIGAAMAQVSGEVDRIVTLDGVTREEAIDRCRDEAVGKARAAGATEGSIAVVDVDESPLTYMPGGRATRIRVKAVGDLEGIAS